MSPTWEEDEIKLTVDHEKCTGCGSCIDVCPSEVFEMQDDKSVVINLPECVECCACVSGCPEEAIEHNSC